MIIPSSSDPTRPEAQAAEAKMRPLSATTLAALNQPPLAAWFMGPKAEQADVWQRLLLRVFDDYIHWRRNYFPQDPTVISRERQHQHERWWDALTTLLDNTLDDLKAHYPVHSPRYVAHMLSEQSLPSVLGYFAGTLYNPNNVTDEAAPVTVRLELEFGKMVAAMLGYAPEKVWAHLCSGGTLANLEALWVARAVTFTPFVLREHCRRYHSDFSILSPNGETLRLTEAGDELLLGLNPDASASMPRALARYEVEVQGDAEAAVLKQLNSSFRKSAYNPRYQGYAAVEQKVGRRPVILVSAAAHYSIKKSANILGYGEESVRSVPVTAAFRLDTEALAQELGRQRKREYVAAVIGIVGTTEEGAIDPIHQIVATRDTLQRDNNRSFWLHLDAAWGGYFRSLFAGHPGAPNPATPSLEQYPFFRESIGAIDRNGGATGRPKQELTWDNPEVYQAMLSLHHADSVTVDPHKMGYVPYPAGVVVFRNGMVTEHLTQRAQYISQAHEGVMGIDPTPPHDAVGPYILEGSKPGFVALGCWLAATAIPLTHAGHGQAILSVVLNAKRLHHYLTEHQSLFQLLEQEVGTTAAVAGRTSPSPPPFTFLPLHDPDTSIVCFVAVPMVWQDGLLGSSKVSLTRLNSLNASLHGMLDIPDTQRGTALPYGKEFFVSQTRFEASQYSYASLKPILKDLLQIPEASYRRQGLTVLRATVMHPLHSIAREEGIDYLWEYLRFLHRCTRHCMARLPR